MVKNINNKNSNVNDIDIKIVLDSVKKDKQRRKNKKDIKDKSLKEKLLSQTDLLEKKMKLFDNTRSNITNITNIPPSTQNIQIPDLSRYTTSQELTKIIAQLSAGIDIQFKELYEEMTRKYNFTQNTINQILQQSDTDSLLTVDVTGEEDLEDNGLFPADLGNPSSGLSMTVQPTNFADHHIQEMIQRERAFEKQSEMEMEQEWINNFVKLQDKIEMEKQELEADEEINEQTNLLLQKSLFEEMKANQQRDKKNEYVNKILNERNVEEEEEEEEDPPLLFNNTTQSEPVAFGSSSPSRIPKDEALLTVWTPNATNIDNFKKAHPDIRVAEYNKDSDVEDFKRKNTIPDYVVSTKQGNAFITRLLQEGIEPSKIVEFILSVNKGKSAVSKNTFSIKELINKENRFKRFLEENQPITKEAFSEETTPQKIIIRKKKKK